MTRQPARIPGTTSSRRALFLLPTIPDEASSGWKNGLAIRNAASTSGVCPDGGCRGRLAGPDEHGLLHIVFEHEADCGVAA